MTATPPAGPTKQPTGVIAKSAKAFLLKTLIVSFVVITMGSVLINGAAVILAFREPEPGDRRESSVVALDGLERSVKESFVVLLSMWSGVIALRKDKEDD